MCPASRTRDRRRDLVYQPGMQEKDEIHYNKSPYEGKEAFILANGALISMAKSHELPAPYVEQLSERYFGFVRMNDL